MTEMDGTLPTEQPHTNRVSPLMASFVAGGVAGVGAVYAGYPLDTVKVRGGTNSVYCHCSCVIVHCQTHKHCFQAALSTTDLLSSSMFVFFASYALSKPTTLPPT